MIVIKYGGHALPQPGEKSDVLQLIASRANTVGDVVLVHGGGPQIDAELMIHGIEREMRNGYRVTTSETFEVVQQVLSGQVLRTIVNALIAYGANPIGLSSADGQLIRAVKMSEEIGLVGDIKSVDPHVIQTLITNKYLPVISPVGVDASGQGLNLNADLVAGAIAGAMSADEVIFMTDVPGIYENWPDESSLMSEIDRESLRGMTFSEGMIPKVKAVLSALDAGAKSARVIDGRSAVNLEAALLGDGGTVIS
jgi:acetylglutamate kinase